MTKNKDQERKLAIIAFGLEMYDAAPNSYDSSFFRALRDLSAAEDHLIALKAGDLRKWLSGEQTYRNTNRMRLARVIEALFEREGRRFDPDWLNLTPERLAEALGLDITQFELAFSIWSRDAQELSLPFSFHIPPSRAARVREKYHGVFYAYRIDTARGEIRRDVLIIGPEVKQGVALCRMVENAKSFLGYVTPTPRALMCFYFDGPGGDGFDAESMVIERHRLSRDVFAAVRCGLDDLYSMTAAVKTVLLRRPELEFRADCSDDELAEIRPHLRTLDDEEPLFKRLYPYLHNMPAASQQAESGGPSDMRLARHALSLNGREVNIDLGDLVDPVGAVYAPDEPQTYASTNPFADKSAEMKAADADNPNTDSTQSPAPASTTKSA